MRGFLLLAHSQPRLPYTWIPLKPVTFCMQFVEPVLHVAQGPQQVQPRLAQISPASSASSYFCRSSMRACCSAVGESCGGAPGTAARAVAQLQLCRHALQLSRRQSAASGWQSRPAHPARAGSRSMCAICISFCCCACSASTLARSASAADSFALARSPKSKIGTLIENPELKLFGGKVFGVKLVDVVQQRCVAVVVQPETDLGQQPQCAPRRPWQSAALERASILRRLNAGAASRASRLLKPPESRECSRDRAVIDPTGNPVSVGQLFRQRRGARFQVQPPQFQLRRRQLRLQKLAQRIHAGLRALLLDLHQPRRILSPARALLPVRGRPCPTRCRPSKHRAQPVRAHPSVLACAAFSPARAAWMYWICGMLKTIDCAVPSQIVGREPVNPTSGNAGSPEPNVTAGMNASFVCDSLRRSLLYVGRGNLHRACCSSAPAPPLWSTTLARQQKRAAHPGCAIAATVRSLRAVLLNCMTDSMRGILRWAEFFCQARRCSQLLLGSGSVAKLLLQPRQPDMCDERRALFRHQRTCQISLQHLLGDLRIALCRDQHAGAVVQTDARALVFRGRGDAALDRGIQLGPLAAGRDRSSPARSTRRRASVLTLADCL